MAAQHHLQQQYHYHYQTQNDSASASVSLSYDPSQTQTHDQSYYAYHYSQPHQDYSSYYYPDYSNSYQTHHTQNDPNSIHPPGVPIAAEVTQAQVQNPHNFYYPPEVTAPQPPTAQGYMPPGHSSYTGEGSHTGQGTKGGGRGTFGRHGRGRGRGHAKHAPSKAVGSSAPKTAQSSSGQSKPLAQIAWCELCRVDCNTLEILEQHKNGKRHKRNLKLQEELQNLSRQQTVQNPQMSLPQSKPESVGSEPAPMENKPESRESGKAEDSRAPPSEGSVRKDDLGGRGGFKRKMRGGRGGKWLRAHDGSRRPVDPPKPKQMVPLICNLCNVKCESQVVYDSHIAGKKHLANMKRFQGHKEAFGEGIEALYPTIVNLPSTSTTLQAHQEVPQEAHALASVMLSPYNLPNPQAAQTALAQLLHQHGIHDAQTLIAQLLPYLLAQFQAPGSISIPAAGPGMVDAQNLQTQGPQLLVAAEKENVETSAETQADKTNSVDAEPDPSVPGKEAKVGEYDKQSN